MSQQPHVYLIHADDAPHYLEEMQKIFGEFKEEGRISGLKVFSGESLTTVNGDIQADDLVLILLTNELRGPRNQLEQVVKSISNEKPQLKLIEVVIDNLPYNNKFITFPSDLRPMRNREDITLVWQDMKDKLRQMLPVQQSFGKALPALSVISNQNLIYLFLVVTAVISLLFPVFAHHDLFGFGLIIVFLIHIFGLYKIFRSTPAGKMIKTIFIVTPIIAILSLFNANRDQDFVIPLFLISGINFIGLYFLQFKSTGNKLNLILLVTAAIALLTVIAADHGMFAFTVFLIPIIQIIGLITVFRYASAERVIQIIFTATLLIALWILFALSLGEATIPFLFISGINIAGLIFRNRQLTNKSSA